MPRLIDDIRASGRFGQPWFVARHREQAWARNAQIISQMLSDPQLPVILIDNVAEYLYKGSDQEYWSLDKDFPNLAPPYPQFWVEHKMVTEIHSKECGTSNVSALVPKGRIGILITAVDPKEATGEGIPENARWILWCELFVDYGRRDAPVDGPHGSIFLVIDSEGRAIDKPWMQAYTADGDHDIMKAFITWLHPAFLAISFMHCKNVVVENNEVPKPLAKKYRERHGGVQPTRYKTLVIEPLKQILKREGRSHEVGLAKAMHICRGHFRDYRQGAGLFGKYHQLVWTPSVIRGTKGTQAPREVEVKV
jgi:hypothetical protein